MATLDEIQAQLNAQISRTAEARMRSTRTGPGQDSESTATPNACPTFTGPLQDEESMPTLTDEIKTFIVKGLACYDTPSQVAEAVKATFGVEVSRQQVYVYDPGCSQPPALRWRDLHAATRQALLRELGEIGIAHRAVRLRRLDRLASRCERNSVALALKCLEMAAKECGGMYENRRPIVLQPAMPQAPTPQPLIVQAPTPQPAPPRSVMPPPSMPEVPAPQPLAVQAPTPQLRAPRPLAVPAQTPQPATPPASPVPPLSRADRYLAYVRDRHERDRAVRAQALLDSGRSSTVPPAS
jgi:hypothetical protein